MHPLTPNLKGLSMDELTTRYNELYGKFIAASRSGSSAVSQMSMVLEDYRYEMQLRQQEMLKEISNKNPSFKNIIDIK